MSDDTDIIKNPIDILASAEDVWRALTDPNLLSQWMLGSIVISDWQVGSSISFSMDRPGHEQTIHDRGTVVAAERGRILRYSHWAETSGLADSPENRTVLTFLIEPVADFTRLTVCHEHFYSYEAWAHARFFWRYALSDIKKVVEVNPHSSTVGAPHGS